MDTTSRFADDDAISYSADARRQFREGDVLCFRGRGPTSWLIRRLTASRYSHIGLVHLHEGRVYCLEAVGVGVRLVLMSHLMRRYHGGIDYFAVETNEPARVHAVSWGFTQLGKLYDRSGIVRYAWTLLTGNAEKARRDDAWFCSELIAAAFSAGGVQLVERAADYTTPQDLAGSPLLALRFTLKP